MFYILYRKINRGDGEHEECDRVYASEVENQMYRLEHYEALKEYEKEWSDCENITFTYFVFPMSSMYLNVNGIDDSLMFYDPDNYSELFYFFGNLKDYKKKCVARNKFMKGETKEF